jgi:hypothetical protein
MLKNNNDDDKKNSPNKHFKSKDENEMMEIPNNNNNTKLPNMENLDNIMERSINILLFGDDRQIFINAYRNYETYLGPYQNKPDFKFAKVGLKNNEITVGKLKMIIYHFPNLNVVEKIFNRKEIDTKLDTVILLVSPFENTRLFQFSKFILDNHFERICKHNFDKIFSNFFLFSKLIKSELQNNPFENDTVFLTDKGFHRNIFYLQDFQNAFRSVFYINFFYKRLMLHVGQNVDSFLYKNVYYPLIKMFKDLCLKNIKDCDLEDIRKNYRKKGKKKKVGYKKFVSSENRMERNFTFREIIINSQIKPHLTDDMKMIIINSEFDLIEIEINSLSQEKKLRLKKVPKRIFNFGNCYFLFFKDEKISKFDRKFSNEKVLPYNMNCVSDVYETLNNIIFTTDIEIDWLKKSSFIKGEFDIGRFTVSNKIESAIVLRDDIFITLDKFNITIYEIKNNIKKDIAIEIEIHGKIENIFKVDPYNITLLSKADNNIINLFFFKDFFGLKQNKNYTFKKLGNNEIDLISHYNGTYSIINDKVYTFRIDNLIHIFDHKGAFDVKVAKNGNVITISKDKIKIWNSKNIDRIFENIYTALIFKIENDIVFNFFL